MVRLETPAASFLPAGRTAVMGIVNVTPDSFSDGGRYADVERAVAHGVRLAAEGADWIDVGGESTRPGAAPVDPDEETSRVVPVVKGLREGTSLPLSIDTTKPEVAAAAIDAGATLVNDVSGAEDPRMLSLVAARGVGIVLMHRQGTPETMQRDPCYEDVLQEVREYLLDRAACAVRAGVAPTRILIDPGIGFGKTVRHNLTLLRSLDRLVGTGFPVLVGASRKSFLGKLLPLAVDERLEGSLAVAVLAVRAGVRVVRVHDVVETVRAVRIAEAIEGAACLG